MLISIVLILLDFVVLLFYTKPSTNFSRITEWIGANSHIRGPIRGWLRLKPQNKLSVTKISW